METSLTELKKLIEAFEITVMLSGKDDNKNAIISINSGAGGTEAQDWASMLSRMYFRYSETNNLKAEFLDFLDGEEAGLKNCSILVKGEFAYGYLKNEIGVHRLVRISPFDSQKRRHTSFASVFVYPEVDETIEIIVNPSDIEWQTFRSSGAGGQHVNTTDSAVRITHLPTKIVVQCQNERSQHKNKETCFNMLKARLFKYEMQKKEEASENLAKSKTDIGWGHQIRSYVLHPYRMVKDNRTDFESSSPDKVLDGEIDEFLESSLYKINA